MLLALAPGGALPSSMLVAAKRPLLSQAPFSVMPDVSRQVVNELNQNTVVIRDMQQLDGEYVLLVTPPGSVPNCTSNIPNSSLLPQRTQPDFFLLSVPKTDVEARGY